MRGILPRDKGGLLILFFLPHRTPYPSLLAIHQMCEFSAVHRRFPFPGKGALAGYQITRNPGELYTDCTTPSSRANGKSIKIARTKLGRVHGIFFQPYFHGPGDLTPARVFSNIM